MCQGWLEEFHCTRRGALVSHDHAVANVRAYPEKEPYRQARGSVAWVDLAPTSRKTRSSVATRRQTLAIVSDGSCSCSGAPCLPAGN